MSTSSAGLHAGDALLVIDVQRDFLPDGALPVPHGDAVVPVLNHCLREFALRGLPVYATRDWHPPNHCSFKAQGGPWPPHCVAGTPGAEMPSNLKMPAKAHVFSKATTPEKDAYSAFQGTDLLSHLRQNGCGRVFVGGLATDYCIKATVLDALSSGFFVVVLEDAIRAVDVQPGDGARAVAEMVARGAVVTKLRNLIAEFPPGAGEYATTSSAGDEQQRWSASS
jgi:nicotinamidase/pyrazinamidase